VPLSAIGSVLGSMVGGVIVCVLRVYLGACSQTGWGVSLSAIGSVIMSILRAYMGTNSQEGWE
jgi:hypothetical protein